MEESFLALVALALAIIAMVRTKKIAVLEQKIGLLERQVKHAVALAERGSPAPASAPAQLAGGALPNGATAAVPHLPRAAAPAAPAVPTDAPLPTPTAGATPQAPSVPGNPFLSDMPAPAAPTAPGAPAAEGLWEPAPRAPRVPNPRWEGLREQLKSNWTGVLGAVILVTGVAFFGVLASLYIGPEGRFALILAFAAATYAGSLWLARKPLWQSFATWLVAISGATALFATVGAGGIDGLKFIANEYLALGVLLAGIGINLVFAFRTDVQQAAALHVVLSLCALAVAPATPVILVVGTAVTLAGTVRSYRERWDINLLGILVGFAAFHAYWLAETTLGVVASRPFGIPCTMAVGLAAALVHYRKDYASKTFEALPFFVHIINWTLFGANIVRYSTGSLWSIPVLAVASILALGLARGAQRRGIRWLHLTDTIVGQILALFALLSLSKADVSDLNIALLVYLQIMAFHILCNREKDTLLTRIFFPVQWCALLGFVLVAVDTGLQYTGFTADAWPVAARLALVGLATIFQTHLYEKFRLATDSVAFILGEARKKDEPEFSVLGFVAAPVVLGAYFVIHDATYAALGMTALVGALLFFRSRNPAPSFNVSFLLTFIGFHALVWLQMDEVMRTDGARCAFLAAPLMLLDLALAFDAFPRRTAIYMAALHITAMTYTLTGPVSDFVPGVAFIVYSLIALEIAAYFRRRAAPQKAVTADYILHTGYAFLVLFAARHILVHLQSEASLGPVSIRLVIELLALGVVFYWLSYAPAIEASTASAINRLLTPYLWEAALAVASFTIAVEAPGVWHPVFWAVIAIALYVVTRHRQWPPRLNQFSWLYLVAAAIHLAFVSSTYNTQDLSWYLRSQSVGPVAVLVQIAYVVLVHRGGGYLPAPAKPLALPMLLTKVRNMLVLYPVIVGLGIFLFFRFEKAVLTLLWVGEVFVVFALGIFLKERHFIRVALAFLAFCVIRLVGYDLAQTNLAVRAGVFVGVGVLMLGINALYRRFKDRLD